MSCFTFFFALCLLEDQLLNKNNKISQNMLGEVKSVSVLYSAFVVELDVLGYVFLLCMR